MITDIFARRYANAIFFPQVWIEWLQPLFVQATHILFQDLDPVLSTPESDYRTVHDRLARELGLPFLPVDGDRFALKCARFLAQPYNLWNDDHGDSDKFIKARLSMLELLFAAAEKRANDLDAASAATLLRGKVDWRGKPKPSPPQSRTTSLDAVRAGITELNYRLRECRAGLAYHNGVLQRETDELTDEQTVGPFWQVVAESKWAVVDKDMKEACDRLDRSVDDGITYAMRALESAIKIISDDRGWSTGKERGAANYIDNLQAARNGAFIATWEAEALKSLFRELRNPHSHGGGSNPPPALNEQQRRWVVENCMSWIKSLVWR
jgi:hypothetical protein